MTYVCISNEFHCSYGLIHVKQTVHMLGEGIDVSIVLLHFQWHT